TWNNQNITVAGNYTTTLLNIVGCDSVATLHLIVNPRSEEHTSELQSHSDLHSFPTRRSSDLTWNNQNITVAGNYTTTLLNIVGCDSVATLHLIVNPNVTGQQTITICQAQLPYIWNGQTITAGGDYNAT